MKSTKYLKECVFRSDSLTEHWKKIMYESEKSVECFVAFSEEFCRTFSGGPVEAGAIPDEFFTSLPFIYYDILQDTDLRVQGPYRSYIKLITALVSNDVYLSKIIDLETADKPLGLFVTINFILSDSLDEIEKKGLEGAMETVDLVQKLWKAVIHNDRGFSPGLDTAKKIHRCLSVIKEFLPVEGAAPILLDSLFLLGKMKEIPDETMFTVTDMILSMEFMEVPLIQNILLFLNEKLGSVAPKDLVWVSKIIMFAEHHFGHTVELCFNSDKFDKLEKKSYCSKYSSYMNHPAEHNRDWLKRFQEKHTEKMSSKFFHFLDKFPEDFQRLAAELQRLFRSMKELDNISYLLAQASTRWSKHLVLFLLVVSGVTAPKSLAGFIDLVCAESPLDSEEKLVLSAKIVETSIMAPESLQDAVIRCTDRLDPAGTRETNYFLARLIKRMLSKAIKRGDVALPKKANGLVSKAHDLLKMYPPREQDVALVSHTVTNILRAVEIMVVTRVSIDDIHIKGVLRETIKYQELRRFYMNYFLIKLSTPGKALDESLKSFINEYFITMLIAAENSDGKDFEDISHLLLNNINAIVRLNPEMNLFFSLCGFDMYIKEMLSSDGLQFQRYMFILKLIKVHTLDVRETTVSMEKNLSFSVVAKKLEPFTEPERREGLELLVQLLLGQETRQPKKQRTKVSNPHLITPIFRLSLQTPSTFPDTLDLYISIAENSKSALNLLSKSGLIRFMISKFQDSAVQDILRENNQKYFELLTMLCSDSITVSELKSLFKLLRPLENFKQPPWFVGVVDLIYKSIKHDAELDSPSTNLLEFTGNDSYLELSGFDRSFWPPPDGYTVSTWVNLDTFDDAGEMDTPDEYEPTIESRIYSFLNEKGEGIELYFSKGDFSPFVRTYPKNYIVVRCAGKDFDETVKIHLDFAPTGWMHISLVHYKKKLAVVYLNGKAKKPFRLQYPSKQTELPVLNRIGSNFCINNKTYIPQEHHLRGQMSYFLMVGKALRSKQIEFLYDNGPSPRFAMLTGISYAQSIIFHFHPKASNDFMCFNQSPTVKINARINNVRKISSSGFTNMIYCIGGIRVFYPMLLISGDHALPVLEIIVLILRHFPHLYKDEFLSHGGFRMISYLVKQMDSEDLITESFVDYLLELFFKMTPSLQINVARELIFDFDLWTATSIEKDSKIVDLWVGTHQYFVNDKTLRKGFDVRVLSELYIFHLWEERDHFSKAAYTRCWGIEQVRYVKTRLLDYLKSTILFSNPKVFAPILGDILVYCIVTTSKSRRQEIIEWTLSLVRSSPAKMVKVLEQYFKVTAMDPFVRILLEYDDRSLHSPLLEILFWMDTVLGSDSAFRNGSHLVLEDIIGTIPMDWNIVDILVSIALGSDRVIENVMIEDLEDANIQIPVIIKSILASLLANSKDDLIFPQFLIFLKNLFTLAPRNALKFASPDFLLTLLDVYKVFRGMDEKFEQIKTALSLIISSILGSVLSRPTAENTERYLGLWLDLSEDKNVDADFLAEIKKRVFLGPRAEDAQFLPFLLSLEMEFYLVPMEKSPEPEFVFPRGKAKRIVTRYIVNAFPHQEADGKYIDTSKWDNVWVSARELGNALKLGDRKYYARAVRVFDLHWKEIVDHGYQARVGLILLVLKSAGLIESETEFDGLIKRFGITQDKRERFLFMKRPVSELGHVSLLVTGYQWIVWFLKEDKGFVKKIENMEKVLEEHVSRMQELIWSFVSTINDKLKDQERGLKREWYKIAKEIVTERGPFELWDLGHTLKWKMDPRVNSANMRLVLKRNYKFDSHFEASFKRDKKQGGKVTAGSEKPSEVMNLQALLSETSKYKIKKERRHTHIREAGNILLCEATDILRIKPLKILEGTVRIYPKYFEFTFNKKNYRILFKDVTEVHQRRYMFDWTGVEIFTKSGKSYYFAFESDKTKLVYRLLDGFFVDIGQSSNFSPVFTADPSDITHSFQIFFNHIIDTLPPEAIVLLEKSGRLHPLGKVPRYDLAHQQRRWARGDITNFDYLMLLNVLSGRSNNDLSQYPVFPWVLVNYKSETLDLDDESNYRDLGCPIGVVSPENRESRRIMYETMKEHYESAEFEDVIEKVQSIPFHYGSHYSSPGIVLYYLLRMEPFTSKSITLQDNKFDVADRLFHDIGQTFQATQTNADFKELIPEFFYQPEFLTNTNQFDLGTKQDGTRVDHVILPPWANGSTVEFIVKHRMALESDYVRKNLHKWIDLIFGVNSRGEGAEKSLNVFHPLSYPENLQEIKNQITAEKDLKWVRSHIQNFGQSPPQLFASPHVQYGGDSRTNRFVWTRDRIMESFKADNVIYHSFASMDSPSAPAARGMRRGTAMELYSVEEYWGAASGRIRFIDISRGDGSASKTFSLTVMGTDRIVLGGVLDFSMRRKERRYVLQNRSFSGTKVGISLATNVRTSKKNVIHFPGSHAILLTCGYWDNSIKIHRVKDSGLVCSIEEHKDIVTCIDYGGEYVVSGGADTLSILWRFRPEQSRLERVAVYRGHDDEITCISIDSSLRLFATGSRDGTIIINSIDRKEYLRTIRLDPFGKVVQNPPDVLQVKILPSGFVLSYSSDNTLYIHTINGRFYKKVTLKDAIVDWDFKLTEPSVLIYLTERRDLCFLSLPMLEEIATVKIKEIAYSLRLGPSEEFVIVGLKNNRVMLVSMR